MSILLADVKVVQTMVDAMVGIPKFSYPARQNNAPKPSGEFAHIRLLEEYPVGIPKSIIYSQTTEETVFRQTTPAKLRFRIGVVDSSGIPSSRVMHGWTSEAVKAIMLATGYGFIKVTPLSDESSKLEKEWEYRQGFSLELYVTRIYEETVNNITAVSLGGTYYNANEQYLQAVNINNN